MEEKNEKPMVLSFLHLFILKIQITDTDCKYCINTGLQLLWLNHKQDPVGNVGHSFLTFIYSCYSLVNSSSLSNLPDSSHCQPGSQAETHRKPWFKNVMHVDDGKRYQTLSLTAFHMSFNQEFFSPTVHCVHCVKGVNKSSFDSWVLVMWKRSRLFISHKL